MMFPSLVGRFEFFSTIYGEKCCLFSFTEKGGENFKYSLPLFQVPWGFPLGVRVYVRRE
jgi:hypothetical protein